CKVGDKGKIAVSNNRKTKQVGIALVVCGRVYTGRGLAGPRRSVIFHRPQPCRLPASRTIKPCPAPKPKTTASTLRLVPGLMKVTNTHAGELTIDAAGRSAHCKASSGAIWQSNYSWAVPATITPGKGIQITLHD